MLKKLIDYLKTVWKQIMCKHPKWITVYCDPKHTHFETSARKGNHYGIIIEGCNSCGLIRFRDWKE